MFDLVPEIARSNSDDLKQLAKVAGGNLKTFYRNADFRNVDLRDQDLTNIDLTGAQLEGVVTNSRTRVDDQHLAEVLEASVAAWPKTIKRLQSEENSVDECDAWAALGDACWRLGWFDKARDAWIQALSVARKLEDPSRTACAFIGLGIAEHEIGDIQGAISVFESAVEIYRMLADRDGQIAAVQRLTRALIDLGDYDGAVKTVEDLWSPARDLNDPCAAAELNLAIGTIAMRMDRTKRGIELFKLAVNTFEKQQMVESSARALWALGKAFIADGNRRKAQNCLQRSMEKYELLDDKEAVASVKADLKSIVSDA